VTPRRFLDSVYDAAGYLAAFFLVGTLAMVLTAIAGRLFNFHLPGTDAYAGYSMAACGFLALAHTLKRGEHIRVTLVLEHSPPAVHTALERISLAVATVLAVVFALYSARLVWQSFEFNDISTSNDATPLWIPQIAMAAGTALLAVAFVDELVLELAGRRRVKQPTEALHSE
jgi:TRAP-type C4-dicarboxylate transport system permease small subunit